MENDTLKRIIELCLSLDENASDIYHNLSLNIGDEELRMFWARMLEEEKTHINWWKTLLDLAEKEAIPQIFPAPEKTIKELEARKEKVQKILAKSSTSLSLKDQFLLAYRLEFYLLHPALEKLWQFLDIIEPDRKTPEQEYNSHITEFINAMRKFGTSIPELEILGETLEHLWTTVRGITLEASFDELTNILNRRGLFNAIKTLAYLAKRNGLTVGLCLIDIDYFKKINDQYGHKIGDSVLVSVVQILSSTIRRSDVLGRYGGEEFLIFLPQIKESSLANLAEKIREAVEVGTHSEIPVTISIGAVSKRISGLIEEEIDVMIHKADECLYMAKAEGRNKIITTQTA
ncbi:diguanylate cyclase [Thermodesulfobacteriota bacterium]